jgi:hypothetical protein
VKRFVCNVLDLKEFVVSDRSYCRASLSTRAYTICECGELEDNNDERRRLSNADDDIYTGGSASAGGKANDVSSSAVSVAVMSEYVAGGFASTVTKTQTVSSSDVTQRTTTIFSLFGCIWGLGFFLVIIQFRSLDPMFSSISSLIPTSLKVSRMKKINTLNEAGQDEIVVRAQSAESTLNKQFEEYIESVIPRVYRPRTFLERFWSELCDRHSYLKVIITAFRRDQFKETALEVGELLTTITLSLLLLALLYDLQYPVDDGTCAQYVTQQSCLDRTSILDPSQSYCEWTIKARRRPALIVGHFQQLELLSSGMFDVVLAESVMLASIDPVIICEFHEYASSFQAAIVVAVVTSCFTALLMRPLQWIFSILRARTMKEIASRIAASQFSGLLGSNASHNSQRRETRQASVLSVVPCDQNNNQNLDPSQPLPTRRNRKSLTSSISSPSRVAPIATIDPLRQSARLHPSVRNSEESQQSSWYKHLVSIVSICVPLDLGEAVVIAVPEETRAARRKLLDLYHQVTKPALQQVVSNRESGVDENCPGTESSAEMEAASAGHLPSSLLRFLLQWQRQREYLARFDAARLLPFETAWMPFIPTADIVMIASPYHQHQQQNPEQLSSLPIESLDPRSAEQRTALISAWKRARLNVEQLQRKLALATETETGVALMQAFVTDLLGSDSPAARFFALAVAKDFAAHATVASDIAQLTCLAIVGIINGFALYFVLLRGVQQGPTWQQAFLLACVAQIFTEMLFFEPLEVLYVDVFLPSFAFLSVQRAQRQVSRLSQSILNSSMRHGSSLLELDVSKVFFASRIVADNLPSNAAVVETKIVSDYRTLWPTGSLRNDLIHSIQSQREPQSESWTRLCFDNEYLFQRMQHVMMTAATFIPLEVQRILVRFFEPFLLGGLFLLWIEVADSAVFLTVFIIGTITMMATMLALCLRSPVEIKHAEVQKEKEDMVDQQMDDAIPNRSDNMYPILPLPLVTSPTSPFSSPKHSKHRKKHKKQSLEEPDGRHADIPRLSPEEELAEDIERYRKPSSSSDAGGRSRTTSASKSPRHLRQKATLSASSDSRAVGSHGKHDNNARDLARDSNSAQRARTKSSDNRQRSISWDISSSSDGSSSFHSNDDVSFASFDEDLSFASLKSFGTSSSR